MVSVARQFASHALDAFPVVSPEPIVAGNGQELQIRELQEQLQSLRLRQAGIQERIRATRNALAALIALFGPGVLNHRQCQAVQSGVLFCRNSDKVDICKEVLQESQEWVSFADILYRWREKDSLSLAQFKNPGASVSNLLRMLERRGEVAVKIEGGERRWKWLGSSNRSADPALHTRGVI